MPTIKRHTKRPWIPTSNRQAQGGRLHPNAEFYQSSIWRKVRRIKLDTSPLCEECLKAGKTTSARIVDHIMPINEGGDPLALDNLQSLCDSCHNKKSGREAHSSRQKQTTATKPTTLSQNHYETLRNDIAELKRTYEHGNR